MRVELVSTVGVFSDDGTLVDEYTVHEGFDVSTVPVAFTVQMSRAQQSMSDKIREKVVDSVFNP